MVKITRKLTKELHHPPTSNEDLGSKVSCALEQRLTCCQGAGFQLKLDGPFTAAELCDCVKNCPVCFGKGRKVVDGISVSCRNPNPLTLINLINNAKIPSRYGKVSLEGFANYTGNGRDVVAFLREWIQTYQHNKTKGLVIGGGVGVGKTYLLASLAKALIKRGISVRFVDFFQLISLLKASLIDKKSMEEVMRPLINVDILIIDEMGKGRSSDFELSVLDQLVMERYNQSKIIIASTNYNLKTKKHSNQSDYLDSGDRRSGFELDQNETLESRIGTRIFSRLLETSQLIEMKGDDFRKTGIQGLSRFPTINPD